MDISQPEDDEDMDSSNIKVEDFDDDEEIDELADDDDEEETDAVAGKHTFMSLLSFISILIHYTYISIHFYLSISIYRSISLFLQHQHQRSVALEEDAFPSPEMTMERWFFPSKSHHSMLLL
jgi:hypothetical protein